MIESIFSGASIRKNGQPNSIATVSIDILPEFGWRFGNHRAFGPGTLFQGHVVVKCNQYSARATRLRLYFKGVESMLTYDVGPGIIRTQTNTLFRVRSTLWQKQDENDSLCSEITYKFLFTLQMPMVQYPPSIDHNLYRCCYKLSAYLDPSLGYGEIPVMAQSHINYIPLIETRLLKAPLYLKHRTKRQQQQQQQQFSSNSNTSSSIFSVKLYSTEFVSGDMLKFAICRNNNNNNSNNNQPAAVSVHTRFYRIFQFHDKEVPTVTETIDSQVSHLNMHDLKEETWHSFKIHDDLVPTVTFSSILSLTYKLKIKIVLQHQRQQLGSFGTINKSKLKKIIPWPSMSTTYHFETPVTIGTMGLGVRVVDELRLYGANSIHIPSPKFVKSLEHEEELPKYEPIRLPCYTDKQEGEGTVVVGHISPASSVTIIRSSL